MRLRFSIRWLLLLIATVAALCWWRDLPRQRANELAAAIRDGDYDRVTRVFDRAALFVSDRANYLGDVELLPRSSADWLWGRQAVVVQVDFNSLGRRNVFTLLVTATGIYPKDVTVSPMAESDR